MAAVLINDPQTEERVRRLAELKGTNLTATIHDAVTAELARLGVTFETKMSDEEKALEAKLDARMRKVTRDYVRLLEADTGKKGGSRVYQMLSRHGAVETLRRLMAKETSGFQYLKDHEPPRLDLAFETLAADREFAPILDAVTIAVAKKRMA